MGAQEIKASPEDRPTRCSCVGAINVVVYDERLLATLAKLNWAPVTIPVTVAITQRNFAVLHIALM